MMKVKWENILKFIEFYHSVGKTSAVLLLIAIYRKSTKTAKVFSHVTFIVHGTSSSDQCRASTDWIKVSSTIVHLLF